MNVKVGRTSEVEVDFYRSSSSFVWLVFWERK